MHLTNNAIQKHSPDYGKVSDGNQLSFAELKKVMEEKGLNFEECRDTMYSHVTTSMNASLRKLNEYNRRFVFEIFGYDFLIDENGYPWLVEVNTNPCLE